jgi:hypothetical protein
MANAFFFPRPHRVIDGTICENLAAIYKLQRLEGGAVLEKGFREQPIESS